MRKTLTAMALMLAASGAAAQAPASTVPPLKGPPPAMTLPAAWTAAQTLPLWPDGVLPQVAVKPALTAPVWPASFVQRVASPYLKVFRPARPNGRTLLVIPGGGYIFVSIANEGVDVAQRFTAKGYTVYVLVYRLPGEGWEARADVPLADAQRAMRLIRSRAPAGEHIAAVGFSAGGHLAATLATDWAAALTPPRDAIDRVDARPDAVGLIYPVITMAADKTNPPSRATLLGPQPSEALVERRSAERHVTAQTPPVFLLHAVDDPVVPVDNSLMMLAAMRAAKRPAEAHIVQEGGHGFGTGFAGTPSGMWPELFDAWLTRRF